MRPISLKKAVISPTNPIIRNRQSEELTVSIAPVQFEFKQIGNPEASVAFTVNSAVIGFEMRAATLGANTESLNTSISPVFFEFRRHPFVDFKESAFATQIQAVGFEFKRHPYKETSEGLQTSVTPVGFEYLGSASAVNWTVSSIANTPLAQYDDTSTFSLSGSNVTTWNNALFNSLHLTQYFGTYYPAQVTNALGTYPAVRFDGTRWLYFGSNTILANSNFAYVFAVLKKNQLYSTDEAHSVLTFQTAYSDNEGFIVLQDGDGTAANRNQLSLNVKNAYNATKVTLMKSTAPSTDWLMLFGCVDLLAKKMQLYVNGEFDNGLTNIYPSVTLFENATSNGLYVGNTMTGNRGWHGDIAALVFGKGKPTLSELDKLFGRYANRYGLTGLLSADHPYKSSIPVVKKYSTKLEFEGVNNSTTFTDQAGKIWTPGGAAVISTGQSKNGSSSYYCPSGSNGYLTTSNHTDFDLSSSDFCLSCWVRPTGTAGSSRYGTIISKRVHGGDFDWVLFQNQDYRMPCFSYGDSAASRWNLETLDAQNSMPADQWTHLAVTRYRNRLTLWINGQQVTTRDISGTIRNRNVDVDVGKSIWFWDSYWAGWIDSLTLVKGDCCYFDEFTPPGM